MDYIKFRKQMNKHKKNENPLQSISLLSTYKTNPKYIFYIITLFLPLIGNSQTLYQEVPLWKNDYVHQTFKIPHPLIMTSEWERPFSSSILQTVSFAQAPFLNGRKCNQNAKKPYIFAFTVKSILSPHTPFKITKAFFLVNKKTSTPHKLFLQVFSLTGKGLRGGPRIYYIAQDSRKNKFNIDSRRIHKGLFYIYDQPSAQKAKNLLQIFQPQKTQTVLLEIETYQEYFEKCGFYQSKENKIENWPEGTFNALVQFSKQHQQYKLDNIQKTGNQIEVSIDKKSLALLLLNSSHLSISNIIKKI